jgi:glutaredoxin
MKTEPEVILYSRPGCHLCELAAQMLAAAGARWREIDIDGDPDLAGRYGLRIPVVRIETTGRELEFPFDADSLARFLQR